MIKTDSDGALSEEHYAAIKTLQRNEGSAWLGRDLRQEGIGAMLVSNHPALSRAHVWTNSFTMAEHLQQEAIAREGPLHSEELFHLLKTVIQGEALSHATQFAQRMRDTADEELVTPLEIFVAAAYREPDLAEELDRADEAAEPGVDEETTSPAQQRQLLRAHVNLGHPPIGEFCRALRHGRCRRGVVKWVTRYFKCPECEARPMPRTRPAAVLPKCYRFNQVCGIDAMEVRNPLDRENPIIISHVICHGTRYHQEVRRQDMTATETFSTLRQCWLKHYDAMEVPIMDQGTEFGADFQHLCQSRGILRHVLQTKVVEDVFGSDHLTKARRESQIQRRTNGVTEKRTCEGTGQWTENKHRPQT